jgi:uncharacterized RDD family membrane protein YckC
MEQQSYLTDLEYNPVLASTGKRFLNYLIDVIIYIILLMIIFLTILETNQRFYFEMIYNDSFSNKMLQRLFAMLIFITCYFLLETILKGRTIGKFITGTKAVNEDGTIITAKTALLRSLSRAVPFEAFSAFGGHPWHDKWTRTFVIDIKQTALNNPAYQQL